MSPQKVGPVLEAGEVAAALIAAIREGNADVEVVDRGSYLRVLCPERCEVTRAAIEGALGRPFHLPSDLEAVMPSFQGKIAVDEERVAWSWGRSE